jgi:hypothetical protein
VPLVLEPRRLLCIQHAEHFRRRHVQVLALRVGARVAAAQVVGAAEERAGGALVVKEVVVHHVQVVEVADRVPRDVAVQDGDVLGGALVERAAEEGVIAIAVHRRKVIERHVRHVARHDVRTEVLHGWTRCGRRDHRASAAGGTEGGLGADDSQQRQQRQGTDNASHSWVRQLDGYDATKGHANQTHVRAQSTVQLIQFPLEFVPSVSLPGKCHGGAAGYQKERNPRGTTRFDAGALGRIASHANPWKERNRAVEGRTRMTIVDCSVTVRLLLRQRPSPGTVPKATACRCDKPQKWTASQGAQGVTYWQSWDEFLQQLRLR